MHEGEITTVDLPVLVADFVAEACLLDRALAVLWWHHTAVPLKVIAWLGPELRTPDNSPPPRFVPAEPGPWNGIIFLEHDEPRLWLLAKSGELARNTFPRAEPFAPMHEAPFGRGYAHQPMHVWPEQEEPEWYGGPFQPPSWRGGP